ncbi:adenylate kinase [Candidatus Dependentiae bacterium]|nr:adenylate kinase [Candidatus Dependentiae bacterium]
MLKGKILLSTVVLGLIFLSGCFIFNDSTENRGKQKEMAKEKMIFTFLGAPGSGKGTLAQRCANNLGFEVLSTGDLFRQHISNKTNIGKKLNEYMEKGQLVPDELVVKMVKEWLTSRSDSDKSIILDGFPRTSLQAKKLLEIIQQDMPNYVFKIVKLEIPQEEISQRLVNRRVCSNKRCQAIYNTSMPEISSGKCPKCGAELLQRKDDTPEVIADRFEVYNKHEKELINFYESEGLEIEKLNVSQKTPDIIFQDFKKML